MRLENFSSARLLNPAEIERSQPASWAPRALSASFEAAKHDSPSFGQILAEKIQQVNEALQEADRHAQYVATGEAEDLHQALLAMAEAEIALQVTMRLTQKAIAAYQEISRMQL